MTRQEMIDGIAAELARRIAPWIEENSRTCVNCHFWQNQGEFCQLFNARPPATVIAFGCEKFEETP